jgi:hypothetical protein
MPDHNRGRCHFRHLASRRIHSARDAQPRMVAPHTELGLIARKPRGTDRSQAVHWDVSTSRRRGTERPTGGDLTPREMTIADVGTKKSRWPGGPWWDGRPSGTPVLRGLDGRLPAEAYSPGGWRSRPFKLPSPSEQEGRYLPDGQGCRREYHLYGAPLPRPANGRQRLPYTLQVGGELARVRGAPDAIG